MDQRLPILSASPAVSRRFALLVVAMLALMTLAIGGLEAAEARQAEGATPVVAGTPVAESPCEATSPGVGAEAWVRSELYFGTTMPDGSPITPEQWQEFLDEEITPRFPDGLTVLEGYGQFLNSQGVIAAEDSIVLIIFHPYDDIETSSASLEEIRDIYEERFDQESVLRVDAEPVCVSF